MSMFARPAVPEIEPGEAVARGDAVVLLDVREDDEWAAGHAPEAVHVAMSRLGDAVDELPRDRPIVCVCRSGNRSASVTQALVGIGVDAVNLVGGMQRWAREGHPVVTEAGAPGAVI